MLYFFILIIFWVIFAILDIQIAKEVGKEWVEAEQVGGLHKLFNRVGALLLLTTLTYFYFFPIMLITAIYLYYTRHINLFTVKTSYFTCISIELVLSIIFAILTTVVVVKKNINEQNSLKTQGAEPRGLV